MLRLVLDTQIWLDWLVFDDPEVRPLRAAVEEGRAEIWMDAACEAELERVLTYDLGRHTLRPEERAAALARARGIARRIEVSLTDAQ
ncbi:MAG: PIN domain-containing protein, partial [Betaproteobacteria bacterium]|nr:PIN domain-containing protein [Betaproteobacteria bacterium]